MTAPEPKPEPKSRPRRVRRLIGRTLRTLALLLLVGLALVTALYFYLGSGGGRRLAQDILVAEVNKRIRGELRIGSIDSLAVGGVTLNDVVLLDVSGRPVLEVSQVQGALDFGALLSGDVTIEQIVVSRPIVQLHTLPDGSLSLLQALSPAEPSEPEPETPDDSPTVIEILDVQIKAGRIDTIDDIALGLDVSDLELTASVTIGGTIQVRSPGISLAVFRDGQPVATLDVPELAFDTGETGATTARIEVSGSGDTGRLAVDATIYELLSEEGPRFDAHLELDRFTTLFLQSLGLEAPDSLPGWLSADLVVTGRPNALDVTGLIATPGGDLQVSAQASEFTDLSLSIASEALALAEVSSAAPEADVAFAVDLESNLDESGTRGVSLALTNGALNGDVLPDMRFGAELQTSAVVLSHLEFPHLGDRFRVSGRYGFDQQASLDLHVAGLEIADEPWVQLFLPESRGRLSLDLEGTLDLEAAQFDAEAHLSSTRLSIPGLTIGDADVSAVGSGTFESPHIDLEATATRIDAGGTRFERADLTAVGGPLNYTLTGEVVPVELPEATFDIEAKYAHAKFTVVGLVRVSHEGETADVRLRDVVIDPASGVDLGVTRIEHRDAVVAATGSFGFTEGADLDVAITRLNLGLFDGRLGLPTLPVGGVVTGQFAVSGQPARPEVAGDLRWRDGFAGPVADARAYVAWRFGSEGLAVDGRIDLGSGVYVDVAAGAEFASYDDPIQALADADYTLEILAEAPDLELIQALAPDAAVSGGSVRAQLALDGPLSRATVDLDLVANAIEVAGRPPLDIALEAHLDDRESGLDGAIRFADGADLAYLNARASFGLDLLTGNIGLNALKREDWSVHLDILPLSPEELGFENPLNDSLPAPVPVEVVLTVDVISPPGEPAGALVKGQLIADLSPLLEGSECGDLEEALVNFQVVAERDRSHLAAALVLDRQRAMQIEVDPGLAMSDVWADPANTLELAHARVTGQIESLDLDRVPIACELADGRLNGTLAGDGLLTATPEVRLVLSANDLRLGTQVSFGVEGLIQIQEDGATVDLAVAPTDGEASRIAGSVPLIWSSVGVPSFGEGDLHGRLVLNHLPTATIATIVPPFRRGQGYLDGSVELGGPSDALWFEGGIDIENVDLMLPGFDQRLTNVNGQIVLRPGNIRIERVTAEDYDGEIIANGDIALEGLQPTDLYVRLRADDFPMRQSGSISARLTTDALVQADMSAERIEAIVTLQGTNVALPETSAGSVQSLDRNPDIVFASELSRFQPDQELVIVEAVPETTIRVRLDGTDPFWVRRNDFSVQMTANLIIDSDTDGTRISGPVEIRRGNLSFYTKDFELQEGSIQFSGANELNPRVELVAVHELDRYPGESVTLRISGELSGPVPTLTTTMAGVTTQAQIVQLLVTGRVDDDTPQQESNPGEQVASLLGGLMAGILTSAARTELGGALPVISVETGDDTGEVGLRAGFIADDLIPSFMRGIVRGAYIEGHVQSESQEDGGEGTTWGAVGGLLIELYFSEGFLTSGSIEPPSNWSFDILWRP